MQELIEQTVSGETCPSGGVRGADAGPTVFAALATDEVGGPCRGLFQLAEHVPALGARILIGLFLRNSYQTSPAIEEAKKRGLPFTVLGQRWRYDPALVHQAAGVVSRSSAAILQSHGYKPALLMWMLRRVTRRPWIAFAHGYTSENSRIGLYNRLDQMLMRRADRVVVVSEATGRLMEHAGISRGRIRVIHNAVEPWPVVNTKASALRKNWARSASEILVGVIGRLSPEKGQHIFLQAWREVVRQIPDARAVFVGEGPERPALEALASDLGLEKSIHFAGYCRDIAMYQALDLIVIPSLSEGLPNVLLEAMSQGKPVVATRVGGIPEVMRAELEDGLTPPNRPAELTDIIRRFIENSELRYRLGNLGRQEVLARFSPYRRAEAVVDLYREMLR